MSYDISASCNMDDFVADLGLPLAPVSGEFVTEIEVTIHGTYTPAILWPNDKAQPAEYPETETDVSAEDLAEQMLTSYRAQLSAAGMTLTADEVAAFLPAAHHAATVMIADACTEALELDAEPPDYAENW